MVQVRRWFNTRPEGIPFLWTAIVFCVFVLFAAPPPGEGEIYLNTGPTPSFLDMNQRPAAQPPVQP
jgi:hypothetical protein